MRFEILIVFLVLISGSLSNAAEQKKSSSQEREEESIKQIRKKIGSKDSINKNLVDPLINGSLMETIDGSQQFLAQLQTKNTQKILELTIQPLPSGDVKILSITPGLTFSVPPCDYPNWVISGVCADGFIVCRKGTWSNCNAFTWSVNDHHQLCAKPVPFSSLGGCYGINNSCGTGLAWSNIHDILSHIGGGALGALAKKKSLVAIGAPKITGTTVTYYGRDISNSTKTNITNILNSSEMQNVLGYAANPHNIENDKTTLAEKDPIFQIIKNSHNKDSIKFVSCQVKRVIKIDSPLPEEIIRKLSGIGTFTVVSKNRIERILGKTTKENSVMNIEVLRPDRIISGIVARKNTNFNEWQEKNAKFNQLLKQKGEFYTYYPTSNDLINSTPGIGSYNEEPDIINIDTSDKLLPDEVVNGCSIFENDSSYLLVDETVDNVSTVHNYIRTGLTPIEQTKIFTGRQKKFQVTRNWFLKERRYSIKNNTKEKYEIDFERVKYIQKHSTDTQYCDQYKQNGKVISNTGNISINVPKGYSKCKMSCKLKKARPQNDIYSNNENCRTTGESQRDPITYDFFYRECQNGKCPLQSGEILVKDCQCLNEFSEAAAMMQVLRMAGNDIICSSGATKALVPPEPTGKKFNTQPNWVCGADNEHQDGVARLHACISGKNYQQLCPLKAVQCIEQKDPKINNSSTQKHYVCPLGEQYSCIKTDTNSIPMCSPHQCINLANTPPEQTKIGLGESLTNDGRRAADGKCLDQLVLFTGTVQHCRTPGLETVFKDCCENQGKVISDNTGLSTKTKLMGAAIPNIFRAAKAGYKAYQACTAGASLSVKAQAGAAAAKSTLVIGFDPASIAASVAIGFIINYLTMPCGESDMNTALLNGSGFCIEIGQYCVTKFPIIGCVQKAKTFCCFNSKMARIIQEQGRRQLKNFSGFGSTTNPQCRGFTPEEFQSLDFSQIDLSEYLGDIHRTFVPEMLQKMEKKTNEYLQQNHH